MVNNSLSGGMIARGFNSKKDQLYPLIQSKNIFLLLYGKALPESSRKLGKIPVFGTNGQCGWHNVSFFNGPGIILGRKGQGPLGVEWSNDDYWVIDTAYSLKLLTNLTDLRFTYYLIKYVGLNHLKDGTSNPSLNRDTFGSQYFPIPSLPIQKAIAHILGTLDDKIELNRLMNETLESIARAIFKSWFINFDPVRAKAEGREPEGMDAETAALFPSEFEVVEGREIPKGWRMLPIDQLAVFLNGLALQKYPAIDDDYLPVVKISQLRVDSTENSDKASINIPIEYIVQNGDLIFSWSGSLEVVIWCGGKGALNQHLFLVKSEKYPKWFLYFWLKYHLPWFQEIAANKATTMGHIQRKHLTEAVCLIPNIKVLNFMDKIISTIIEKIILNKVENKNLSSLRDTLLPKLLSGELQIENPDSFLEATS